MKANEKNVNVISNNVASKKQISSLLTSLVYAKNAVSVKKEKNGKSEKSAAPVVNLGVFRNALDARRTANKYYKVYRNSLKAVLIDLKAAYNEVNEVKQSLDCLATVCKFDVSNFFDASFIGKLFCYKQFAGLEKPAACRRYKITDKHPKNGSCLDPVETIDGVEYHFNVINSYSVYYILGLCLSEKAETLRQNFAVKVKQAETKKAKNRDKSRNKKAA